MNTFNDAEYDRVCDENEKLKASIQRLEGLFRSLRRAWWWKALRRNAPERDWEDEEDERFREGLNAMSYELFDKQTRELIAGHSRCLAPQCDADMD